jgi:magnesium transporter
LIRKLTYDHLQVRDELENLLDDDADMAELYLTDKLAKQKFEIFSAASSMNNNGDDMMTNRVLPQDIVDRYVSSL